MLCLLPLWICGVEISFNLASYYAVKLAILSKSVQHASDLLK